MRESGGRAFEAEGTANAKALGQERTVTSRTRRKAAWLERRE